MDRVEPHDYIHYGSCDDFRQQQVRNTDSFGHQRKLRGVENYLKSAPIHHQPMFHIDHETLELHEHVVDLRK